MTDKTPDRAALTAEVQRLSAALRQAQDDVALMHRLKTAEADAKRLEVELSAAQAALIAATTDAILVQRAAGFANFEDITITETGTEPGILHRNFGITVKRKAWDGYNTVSENQDFGGFANLPKDAFAYLVAVHPDRIPASIMALAPDDPTEAFAEYFIGQRRGYLTTAAAA
jgi:hypothetical protein